MNIEQINQEIQNWNDESFLSKITAEFNDYVGSLDELMSSKYLGFIRSISQKYPSIAQKLMKTLSEKQLITFTRKFNKKSKCCFYF